MKSLVTCLVLLSTACLAAAAAPAGQAAPVVLPAMVVMGSRIPPSCLADSWECTGPFPINRIKRAWISMVLPDGPAAKAGFKVGDALLAIGGVPVETMTGVSFRANVKRDRPPGTDEEFSIQTPGSEKRTVVVSFRKKKPDSLSEPPP